MSDSAVVSSSHPRAKVPRGIGRIDTIIRDGLLTWSRLRLWRGRLRLRHPAQRCENITALTALTIPGTRERCLEAGASVYVTKPVDLNRLVEIILRFLQP